MNTTNDLNVSLARLMGLELREMPAHHSHEDGWITPSHYADGETYWFSLNCNRGEKCVDKNTQRRKGPWEPHYSLCWVAVPDWAGSLDALFAPGGPVEYANSKGLGVWLGVRGGAVARIMRNIWSKPIRVACADPAEALATALHEAFMKEQGQ